MFAIVRTGGKQYRVAAGDKIAVEKIEGEAVSLTYSGNCRLSASMTASCADAVSASRSRSA